MRVSLAAGATLGTQVLGSSRERVWELAVSGAKRSVAPDAELASSAATYARQRAVRRGMDKNNQAWLR